MNLDAIQAMGARDWHVFPLRPNDKRPAVADWEHKATTDPDRIASAWGPGGPFERSGVGVACGPSRLVVIDLDTRKGEDDLPPPEWDEPGIVDGADVIAELYARNGTALPVGMTPTCRTGSGGMHLYYAAGEQEIRNSAGRLGWKVDVRAAGGYVVAPPSVAAGKPYEWLAALSEPLPLPEWLATCLASRPTVEYTPSAPSLSAAQRWLANGSAVRSAVPEKLLAGLVDVVLQSRPGQRNDTLNWAAYRAFEHARDHRLDARQAAGALRLAGLAVGPDEKKITGTIRSAYRAVFGSGLG